MKSIEMSNVGGFVHEQKIALPSSSTSTICNLPGKEKSYNQTTMKNTSSNINKDAISKIATSLNLNKIILINHHNAIIRYPTLHSTNNLILNNNDNLNEKPKIKHIDSYYDDGCLSLNQQRTSKMSNNKMKEKRPGFYTNISHLKRPRSTSTSPSSINFILVAILLALFNTFDSFSQNHISGSVSAQNIARYYHHYSASASPLSLFDASSQPKTAQHHYSFAPSSGEADQRYFIRNFDDYSTQHHKQQHNLHNHHMDPDNYHHELFGSNAALKYKMLNQLRLNRELRAHHNSQSRLTDPIFDPNVEELLLHDSHEQQPQKSQQQEQQQLEGARASVSIMAKQQSNNNNNKNLDKHKSSTKPNETRKSFNEDNMIEDLSAAIEDDIVPNLSFLDQKNSIEKIINSGFIQNLSTKKLLYYLRKVDEVLYKEAGVDSDISYSMDDIGESLNPEEDEIWSNKQDKEKRGDTLRRKNKNFEIMMNRISSTSSVAKKRGEGPQLSIDYPLTVLRQRLIAELARRKAKETEEQIAINTEILKKLGRRRRRSIMNAGKPYSNMQPQSTNMIDCDVVNCNVQDANWKRSNLYQSILGNIDGNHNNNNNKEKKMQLKRNPFYKTIHPLLKNKFRNNDKFIMFDKANPTTNDNDNNDNIQPQQLNYDVDELFKNRIRINSKKPSFLSVPKPSDQHLLIEDNKDMLMASIDNPPRIRYWFNEDNN